jgi:pSer/pThr/pTyr-binding forkhead associated (FHA) protein
MADAHLNSIHLEPDRREEFRRARDVLLGSVGEQTFNAAGIADLAPPDQSDSRTILQEYSGQLPPGYDYVLVEKGDIHKLKIGVNTVGRLSDNDVVLSDPYLSRRHCAILVHATKDCELHDVASKNGTFVNGRKISGPTALHSGDEIRMCDHQLVFLRRSDLGDTASHDHTMVT